LSQTEAVFLPEKPVLRQPQKAVWGKNRKYTRRSVDKNFKKFSGFKTLKRIVDAAPNELVRAFIVFLWTTGSRVSEALNLRKEMFTLRTDTDPPILVVTDAPLEKRYKKIAEYFECLKCGKLNHKAKECFSCGADLVANGKRRFITEKEWEKTRNEFVVRLDGPFSPIILAWLKQCDDYLFLNYMTGLPYSRKWAYVHIKELGDKLKIELWPHKFRAERASYLGTHLAAESLLEYFSWENWATAKRYARKGAIGLAKELGVKIRGED